MNRRDFIGAAIGALVAALLLPFEEFAAWCKRWLGPNHLESFRGINREPVQTWADYVYMSHLRHGMSWNHSFHVFRSVSDTVTARITKVDRARGTITVSA